MTPSLFVSMRSDGKVEFYKICKSLSFYVMGDHVNGENLAITCDEICDACKILQYFSSEMRMFSWCQISLKLYFEILWNLAAASEVQHYRSDSISEKSVSDAMKGCPEAGLLSTLFWGLFNKEALFPWCSCHSDTWQMNNKRNIPSHRFGLRLRRGQSLLEHRGNLHICSSVHPSFERPGPVS